MHGPTISELDYEHNLCCCCVLAVGLKTSAESVVLVVIFLP